MAIWKLPEEDAEGEIIDGTLSIYNGLILQPLCNWRNNVMSSDLPSCAKYGISSLCATSMVLSALLVGTAEVVIRIAFAIITAPLLICSNFQNGNEDSNLNISLLGLFGAGFTALSIYSGMRAAIECFTKSQNIESFRTDFFLNEQ